MIPTVRLPEGSAALAILNTSWFARLLRASITALQIVSRSRLLCLSLDGLQNDCPCVGCVSLDQSPDNTQIFARLILGGIWIVSPNFTYILLWTYCEKGLAHLPHLGDVDRVQKFRCEECHQRTAWSDSRYLHYRNWVAPCIQRPASCH